MRVLYMNGAICVALTTFLNCMPIGNDYQDWPTMLMPTVLTVIFDIYFHGLTPLFHTP